MTVDISNHVPAISFKTFWRIITKPAINIAINGNVVVIIKTNQFSQTKGTGQRARLVRNTFHKATVTQEYKSLVVNNFVAVFIELRGQDFFSQRHTNSIGNTLP